MKIMNIDVVKYRRCTAEDFLELAAAEAGDGAWALFESAKNAGLTRLADFRDPQLTSSASRLIVFSAQAELRLEKACSKEWGEARIVRMDTFHGTEYRVREGEYILRRDSGAHGRLVHREFFRPEQSGMLTLFCECLAGIKEGGR